MAGFTNAAADVLLGWYFTPNVHWIGLHNTDPTAQGLASGEIQGGSYERQQITWSTVNNRTVHNTNTLKWVNLPASTVNYLAMWGQQTGGSIVYVLQIPPQNFNSGGTFTIPVSDITLSLI